MRGDFFSTVCASRLEEASCVVGSVAGSSGELASRVACSRVRAPSGSSTVGLRDTSHRCRNLEALALGYGSGFGLWRGQRLSALEMKRRCIVSARAGWKLRTIFARGSILRIGALARASESVERSRRRLKPETLACYVRSSGVARVAASPLAGWVCERPTRWACAYRVGI